MAIIVQQSLVSVPARAFVERFKFNNSFETVGVSLGLDTYYSSVILGIMLLSKHQA